VLGLSQRVILLLRILPLSVGLLQAGLFWWQDRLPGAYPWLALAGVACLPLASVVISWGRVKFGDLMEKMAPTFVLVAVLSFALLLVEGRWELNLVVGLAALSSFVSLELLFLLARNPAAYPVNGLSHVNVAYVPLAVFYAVSTSNGLLVFLHSAGVWHVALCALLGVILFRTTGHPGASRQQNGVWMAVGGLVGVESGLIGLLLPIGMSAQGLVATLLFCGALRIRRYLYDPKPPYRLAFAEGLVASLLFVVSLATAKWF